MRPRINCVKTLLNYCCFTITNIDTGVYTFRSSAYSSYSEHPAPHHWPPDQIWRWLHSAVNRFCYVLRRNNSQNQGRHQFTSRKFIRISAAVWRQTPHSDVHRHHAAVDWRLTRSRSRFARCLRSRRLLTKYPRRSVIKTWADVFAPLIARLVTFQRRWISRGIQAPTCNAAAEKGTSRCRRHALVITDPFPTCTPFWRSSNASPCEGLQLTSHQTTVVSSQPIYRRGQSTSQNAEWRVLSWRQQVTKLVTHYPVSSVSSTVLFMLVAVQGRYCFS